MKATFSPGLPRRRKTTASPVTTAGSPDRMRMLPGSSRRFEPSSKRQVPALPVARVSRPFESVLARPSQGLRGVEAGARGDGGGAVEQHLPAAARHVELVPPGERDAVFVLLRRRARGGRAAERGRAEEDEHLHGPARGHGQRARAGSAKTRAHEAAGPAPLDERRSARVAVAEMVMFGARGEGSVTVCPLGALVHDGPPGVTDGGPGGEGLGSRAPAVEAGQLERHRVGLERRRHRRVRGQRQRAGRGAAAAASAPALEERARDARRPQRDRGGDGG